MNTYCEEILMRLGMEITGEFNTVINQINEMYNSVKGKRPENFVLQNI